MSPSSKGKATLTGHSDPQGFEATTFSTSDSTTSTEDGPIMGRDIPPFFQLAETGTGVFIMGFNPHSSDWVDEVATAVIENFFHAIHHQNLTVDVIPKDGSPSKYRSPDNRLSLQAAHAHQRRTQFTTTGAIRDLPEGGYRTSRGGLEIWGALRVHMSSLLVGRLEE